MLRIAIVAGEPSGDLLGAELIESLQELLPQCQFEGIAGAHMQAAGCKALYPMERLSVMGLVEVLGRYRELHAARARLIKHWQAQPPDVFIGIDAPDFNLGLERALKRSGVRTVHFVSPSVWAWKRWRLRAIKQAVDLMLTLFPFEERFYLERGIPVTTVGHPLADRIPLQLDASGARKSLGLDQQRKVLGLLPGSRTNEWHALGPVFFQTLAWLAQRQPGLQAVVPLVNERAAQVLRPMAALHAPAVEVCFVDGQSHQVMQASDCLLLASGTAALEGMLFKRPMVIAYRLHPLSYALIRWMTRHLRWYALPNLLAEKTLAPELIQDQVNVGRLGPLVLQRLRSDGLQQEIAAECHRQHLRLKRHAGARAAKAVAALLNVDAEARA